MSYPVDHFAGVVEARSGRIILAEYTRSFELRFTSEKAKRPFYVSYEEIEDAYARGSQPALYRRVLTGLFGAKPLRPLPRKAPALVRIRLAERARKEPS